MNKQYVEKLKELICELKDTLNVAHAAITCPADFLDASVVARKQVEHALEILDPWMTILWENEKSVALWTCIKCGAVVKEASWHCNPYAAEIDDKEIEWGWWCEDCYQDCADDIEGEK